MSLVKVLLLDEWLGHPKNSVRNIPEWKFKDLESRGVAKLFSDVEDETKGDETEKDESENPKKLKDSKKEKPKKTTKTTEKRVGRPPKDKMMKSSETQNK